MEISSKCRGPDKEAHHDKGKLKSGDNGVHIERDGLSICIGGEIPSFFFGEEVSVDTFYNGHDEVNITVIKK